MAIKTAIFYINPGHKTNPVCINVEMSGKDFFNDLQITSSNVKRL